MNHARDDVLASSTFTLNEHGNVRSGDFFEPILQGKHGLRPAKNHCGGRKLAE
jgi:hypothetical protein